MRAILIGSALVLAELSSPAVAAPAPDIVGKSVLVSWTENEELVGGAAKAIGLELRLYISSAGRPFTRVTATGRWSAMNEQVGRSGTSNAGGVRAVRVDGHTVILQAIKGNYAKNLRVEIAPGGGSCSAQMSIGKEVGTGPRAFRSPLSGAMIEIHSLTVSGVSCSMQQGNVFAN
jgi:hypothetical protein